MLINFKNVVFVAQDFKGAITDGKTLYIYVGPKTFDIDFKTSKEAEEARLELYTVLSTEFANMKATQGIQSEKSNELEFLSDLFSAAKTAVKDDGLSKVISSVEGLTDKLNGFLGSAKSKAKKAVVETVVNKAANSFEQRMDALSKELSDAIESIGIFDVSASSDKATKTKSEPETKPEPKVQTKKRRTFTPDVFGSTPVQTPNEKDNRVLPPFPEVAGTPDEPLIGDMTQAELEDYIDQFMQDVLSNERVQDMFQSILSNFDAEKASEALSGYKKVVLTIALQNPELTLTQVIQNYFM